MTGDVDLCRAFLDAHRGEAAHVLERLGGRDAASLLEAMPAETAARVLEQMMSTVAAEGLSHMPAAVGAALIARLRLDQGAALLRRLDDAHQAQMLEQLPRIEADALRALLRYPPHTAGALMDPRVPAVGDDVTVADALAVLRRSPGHVLDDIYVTNRAHRLLGAVAIRELLLARPDSVVRNLARAVSPVGARMGHSAILAHQGWRHHRALPVVDEDWQLVGAIRHETFRALEDAARGAAQRPDAVATVFALGELYWIGLFGIVDALASIVTGKPRRAGDSGEASHGVS